MSGDDVRAAEKLVQLRLCWRIGGKVSDPRAQGKIYESRRYAQKRRSG